MSQIDVSYSVFPALFSRGFPILLVTAATRNLWSNQRRILHIQDIFGGWFRAAGHG
jgi:hypothetical protein